MQKDRITNNRHIIEKEKNSIYRIYIIISILFLTSITILFANINYTRKETYIKDPINNEVRVRLENKESKLNITNNNYQIIKIYKKDYYYEAKIKLKENKRIKIEVENKTTVLKSIINDFRKELNNAKT